MPESYLPVVFLMVVALGLGTMFTLLSIMLGPVKRTATKSMPFESGMPSAGSQYRRYSVRFYMVALAFLIFDVEIVFFYPWAAVFSDLGWFRCIRCGYFKCHCFDCHFGNAGRPHNGDRALENLVDFGGPHDCNYTVWTV